MKQGGRKRELDSQNNRSEKIILMSKPQTKARLHTPQRDNGFAPHTLALASSG